MRSAITKYEHRNAGYDRNLWHAQAKEAHPRDHLQPGTACKSSKSGGLTNKCGHLATAGHECDTFTSMVIL
jgi:hypothetical protein